MDFRLAARALGLSSASGTRAASSLLLVALAARFDGIENLPPQLAFLTSNIALAALLTLAVVENRAHLDDSVHEILGLVQYGTSGAAGALASYVTLEAHLPPGMPDWVPGVIGALIAISTQGVRRRLYRVLDYVQTEAFHPRVWLARLEEGGAIGVAVAAFLAPFLAVALAIAGLVSCAVALVLVRRLERALRRPCTGCGARVRPEASRCPNCRQELVIEKRLHVSDVHALRRLGRATAGAAVDVAQTLRSKVGTKAARTEPAD